MDLHRLGNDAIETRDEKAGLLFVSDGQDDRNASGSLHCAHIGIFENNIGCWLAGMVFCTCDADKRCCHAGIVAKAGGKV